jgi:hypothetical protein
LYIAKINILQFNYTADVGTVHEGVMLNAKKIGPFVEPIDGMILVVIGLRVVARILPEDQNR